MTTTELRKAAQMRRRGAIHPPLFEVDKINGKLVITEYFKDDIIIKTHCEKVGTKWRYDFHEILNSLYSFSSGSAGTKPTNGE